MTAWWVPPQHPHHVAAWSVVSHLRWSALSRGTALQRAAAGLCSHVGRWQLILHSVSCVNCTEDISSLMARGPGSLYWGTMPAPQGIFKVCDLPGADPPALYVLVLHALGCQSGAAERFSGLQPHTEPAPRAASVGVFICAAENCPAASSLLLVLSAISSFGHACGKIFGGCRSWLAIWPSVTPPPPLPRPLPRPLQDMLEERRRQQ